MTLNQSMLDVCEEALFLLRQDVTLPTLAAAPTATDMEWLKCKKAIEYAAAEVLAAHDWTFATTDAIKNDLSKWPANIRKLAVYALARELAVQIAGRTEDLKNWHGLYEKMLADARVKDLTDQLKTNTDPVLSELVANIKLDDPGLPRTVAIYTARKTAVNTESENEVKATLGVSTLDNLAKAAVVCLSVSKLAAACGLDANFKQLKIQEYQAKIVEWRKVKLNEELAKENDLVLSELLGSFRSDDTALVNAYTIYTKKSDVLKEEARREVGRLLGLVYAHGLYLAKDGTRIYSTTAADGSRKIADNFVVASDTNPNQPKYYEQDVEPKQYCIPLGDNLANAIVYTLVEAQLCTALGLDANVKQLKMQEYNAKVLEWRRLQLNKSLESNTDPVLAELLSNFRSDDAGLLNAFTIYTKRAAAVKTESENEVKATLGVTTLDNLAKAAVVCLSVAKLATVCGLDANVKQLKLQEYQTKIIEWRKLKLNDSLQSNTDPVLAELLSNFRSDDAGLINAYTVYTKRAAAVKTESENEVKATLGVTTLDNLAKAAVVCLSVAKLATVCGLDANVKQLKLQEYQTKIIEWRKLKLNESLATNKDPVLAELLANFRADDAGLVNAFTIFSTRAEAVKASAEIEINMAHNWQKRFSAEDKSHVAWSAFLALCVSKLAIPCGISGEAIAALEAKYQLRLKEARVADLEDSPLPEGPIGDVLVFLRGTFSAAEAALPRDLNSLVDKVKRLLESAKKEVLSSHPWSFAQDEDVTPCIRVRTPGAEEYAYAVDVPVDAIKVTAVYGCHGLLKATRQIAGQIRATDPITRVVYTRNIDNWEELSTDAQRLVVLRLASDMAKALGAKEDARKLQEQLYRDALSDAKYRDTRETEPGRSVWGKNHYAEVMAGENPLRR